MSHYKIIAGTTAPLRFQLLEAGAPIDLTGSTVTLLLSDKTGATVTSPGTVTVTTAVDGKVELAPTDVNVFVAANGPYLARWKVVDVGAKIYYVPTGPRDVWEINGA
jgi:hypothetical protein